MNTQDHKVYFELFCKLHDLFSPFYWGKGLNCAQKQLMEHFGKCYWEDFRGGNINVDDGSAPYYLEDIRQVGYSLLCEPVDPDNEDDDDDEWDVEENATTFKTAKEIFNEQECRQIQEDLAVIELIYILTMCSGHQFITDEQWSEIMDVLTHNSPARNPYESLMPRIVDWCRANPVLICGDSEVEKEVADQYRLLVS